MPKTVLLFAWNLIRICHIIHPCLLTPSDPYYPTFWCSKFSYCGSIVAWWRDENKPHIFGLKIMVLCYGEGDNWVQYVGQNNIHDVIKQNESEVTQIQFSFFWLIVYIICKATFYNRSHWNLLIVFKDMGSWRVAKTTRHVAVTDGVPCRLWDIDPWLTPVSLFIPQTWCKCMNYMNTLSNIKEVMQFEWKSKFDPYDPKWPRLTFDPKKDIGSQAYAYVWVTWIYYEK